jgi:ankyrin repeat protein
MCFRRCFPLSSSSLTHLDISEQIELLCNAAATANLKLLSKHVNLWARVDQHGSSPGHYAVTAQQEGVIVMMKNMCEIQSRNLNSTWNDIHPFNIPDKQGLTPLHWSIMVLHPNPEIMVLLIQGGADVKLKTKDGKNIIHLAALQESPHILASLVHLENLRRNLDDLAHEPDHNGNLALQIALGRLDRQSHLMQLTKLTDPTRCLLNKVCMATYCIKNGFPETFQQLIQSNPKWIPPSSAGVEHPLHMICGLEDEDKCVQFVSHCFSDPDSDTRWDWTCKEPKLEFTPLHCLVSHGHFRAISLLLEKHSNASSLCSQQDRQGNTPLHLSVLKNQVSAVEMLVPKSKSIANSQGLHPAHIAAAKGLVQVSELLYAQFNNVNISDEMLGRSPLVFTFTLFIFPALRKK